MRVVSSVRRRRAESARSSRAGSPSLESVASSSSLTNAGANANGVNGVNGAKQPLVNRMVDSVFGQKGVNDTVSEEKRAENPLTRLKLLIVSFPCRLSFPLCALFLFGFETFLGIEGRI